TEAAFGSGIVCAGGADPFSPRALRASAGALLRLPLVETGSPGDAVAACRGLGLRLVGGSPRARTGYRDADLGGAIALFVGSEGPGLGPDLSRSLDLEVSIPMRAGAESLNVATAAAVILFEAATRR
ncbi:MAG TPA: RNA methyltransferase, partial [Verrucomicrobiae bacterium]|nr:RNA methyltransferase [Verrucomicrobiae bacterium]